MPTKTRARGGMLTKVQGFKLVACAGTDAGLYRKGDEWGVYSDGAFSADVSELAKSSYGYPKSPNGKSWRWLFSKDGGEGAERIARRENGRVVRLANGDAGDGALD